MKQAIADALHARGYTTLTPVQQAVSLPEHAGADLLVSAQTGSGKTVAFGIAIAPSILGEADKFEAAGAPLALVIAPTRELAMQVKRELGWLFAGAGAVLASCVGGMDMRDERRALARGAHIVVATPGRLRDHLMRGSIDLGAVQAVVLDEADEMLDLGFREDLEFILGQSPEDRQTLLFSATVPKAIATLAQNYQRGAIRVATRAEESQHADIDYRAMSVAPQDAENAIINVLRYFEAPNAIVFCNTRAMVGRMTTRLSNRGFSVVALSGELSQSERSHALQAMRDGRARVCVATDVAARGIDLPNLDLVVHAELPSSHETLLHRSGRTGRAGRKGVSALIVPPKSRKKAERILQGAKVRATWTPAPGADEVMAQDETRMLADPAWHEAVAPEEQAAVDKLTGHFTATQLAAAYLRLRAERHSAPEDLSDPGAKPEPRAPFGPSVWFSITGGRAAGAEPRRLLPVLCNAGGITRDDIGAIRVRDEMSYVEIRKPSAASFIASIGPGGTVEGGATVTQMDRAPDFVKSGGPARPAKPARAPKYAKPAGASKHAKPKTKSETAMEDGALVSKRSPTAKRGKPDHAKGPPPPKGKPSSKKNRVRAAAAKNAGKPGARGKGGPKRGAS
ncbi:DEAD/DEAH box helicase [Roseovarius pelagicus]|uniref:DEAD/DEAH box helicase n=1 Tax=Roseovarius pelagicus TaxID=2980108 RepID=A0ABY6DEY8_9RHOB|nr:DEAD/DEAH box helicase [Roseovarius pelagicus]UXX83533.1 DEAD/DEAH box helicase [Roseovarius pelagicus]